LDAADGEAAAPAPAVASLFEDGANGGGELGPRGLDGFLVPELFSARAAETGPRTSPRRLAALAVSWS